MGDDRETPLDRARRIARDHNIGLAHAMSIAAAEIRIERKLARLRADRQDAES